MKLTSTVITFSCIILLFIVFESSIKKNNLIEITMPQEDIILVETFNEIPDLIDGCGCDFYLTEKDMQEKRYVFVNNFSKIGFVKINGRLEQFNLKAMEQKASSYHYVNDSYELSIQILKKESSNPEESKVFGVVQIKKNKHKVEKNVIGYCGC